MLASAVSLLLCAAVVTVWVRSYWVADGLRFGRTRPTHAVMPSGPGAVLWRVQCTTNRGVLRLRYTYQETPRRDLDPWLVFAHKSDSTFANDDFRWPRLAWAYGFSFEAHPPAPAWDARRGREGAWAVSLPLWSAALVTGILPAGVARRAWRRRRLRDAGRCAACGYDLRATGDRCPECGAVPEAAPRTAA